jgi:hypothetical protein
MEEFSEIDEILLEFYDIEIDDGKFNKLIRTASTCYVIIVIIIGYLTATLANFFFVFTFVTSFLIPYFLTIKFWFICRHLKIRFDTIEKFFSSKADDQIMEVHYSMVQTIFLRSSRIIKLRNKFFQIKFLVIIGE